MTEPGALRQFDIQFTSGQNQLAGIIVMPAAHEPCPGIILFHGSGPADRDSNGTFVALRQAWSG